MKQTTQELIDYFENYNKHRLYSILDRHHGNALDQAVDLLKTMTWQPMETAPKDREFLGVWGSPMDVQDKSVDLFRYDQDSQQYVWSMWSNYGGAAYVPSAELFAWMEIPKYEG
jgi:hypothetical protein